MHVITLMLTALSLAMDAFSVSVLSGIVIKKLRLKNAFKIGLFFGVFQFIMPMIGWGLGNSFASLIEKFAPIVAFLLLGFVGGKMIWEAMHPDIEEIGNPLDNKMLTVMAIATSIDALAVGVTYSAMGYGTFGGLGISALPNSIVIGAVAFILSSAGVYIGNKSGDIFGNKAEIIGGIILLGIGIKILIEGYI